MKFNKSADALQCIQIGLTFHKMKHDTVLTPIGHMFFKFLQILLPKKTC